MKLFEILKSTFLGGTPTSICHFLRLFECLSVCLSVRRAIYLKNLTLSDHNLGKRAKSKTKGKITITSVTRHISGTV